VQFKKNLSSAQQLSLIPLINRETVIQYNGLVIFRVNISFLDHRIQEVPKQKKKQWI